MVEFAGTDKPRRAPRGPSKKKVREEVRAMLVSNDFSAAKASHLVALYEWCHEQVYGAMPAELDTGNVWKLATYGAGRLIRDEFSGDVQAAVEFVRWTWKRERVREAKRSGELGCFRLGWRLQFVSKHLVTDYRIDMARVAR